ncbi:unnamed protein product, partial [Lampetra fluviatilis]
PYTCCVCGRGFGRVAQRDKHQRIHLARPLSYEIRAARLIPAIVRRGRRQETAERLRCDWCPYSSEHVGSMRYHARVHTGERPYQCGVCEKSFAMTGQLKSHSRIHTGERPYSCHVCGKSFARSGELSAHTRTHPGAREEAAARKAEARAEARAKKAAGWMCGVCGRNFSAPAGLKRHSRSHSGERPYVCGACGADFSRAENLRRHRMLNCGGGEGRSLGLAWAGGPRGLGASSGAPS